MPIIIGVVWLARAPCRRYWSPKHLSDATSSCEPHSMRFACLICILTSLPARSPTGIIAGRHTCPIHGGHAKCMTFTIYAGQTDEKGSLSLCMNVHHSVTSAADTLVALECMHLPVLLYTARLYFTYAIAYWIWLESHDNAWFSK